MGIIAQDPSVPAPPKPAAFELRWTAPEGCPTEEAIAARVADLAPNPSGGEGTMLLEATVERGTSGFTLALRVSYLEQVDERVIEAQDCGALGESTALVVAIALEPGLESSEPQDRPDPENAEESIEDPTDSTVPSSIDGGFEDDVGPPDSQPPAPRRNRGLLEGAGVRLSPMVEFGALPSVTGGVAATMLVAWPRWRFELFGAYLVPQRGAGPGDSAGLAQLGVVGVRGCRRLFAGPVEFPLCLGLETGALRVDSRGLTPENTLHYAWLAPSATAGLSVGGERVRFYAAPEVAVGTLRSRILVNGDPIFETGLVSLRLLLGLEIFFAIET